MFLNKSSAFESWVYIRTLFSNYDFKKEFALSYMKLYYFLHGEEKKSKLLDVSIQVLTSEELAYIAVKSEHFLLFLKVVIFN